MDADMAAGWLAYAGYGSLWLCLVVFFFHLFQGLLPSLNRRFRIQALYRDTGSVERIPRWLRALLLPRKPETREWYTELLAASGAGIDVSLYFALKRFTVFLSSAVLIWILAAPGKNAALVAGVILTSTLLLVAAAFDRIWLEAAARRRKLRITSEIYALCHQLSYYAGSGMNLHTKLVRCAPFTVQISREWNLLLNEWYEDPEEALYRFRTRLGTDEAYSFTETLSAMRQGESDDFYRLLRQRIADYKAAMDLYQEGRQESFSYVLFVLAGIPILNTFRVFIYPWVEEGRKLFESLQ